MLKRSASAWLDIASEFGRIHQTLRRGAEDADAPKLPRGGAVAIDAPGCEYDKQRRCRVEQHGVDGLGVAQAEIGGNLIEGAAAHREAQQQGPGALQHIALADEARYGEGREDESRDRPAPEGHGHRRDAVAQGAAQHPIAGPHQHAGGQQEIRIERGETGDRRGWRGDNALHAHGVLSRSGTRRRNSEPLSNACHASSTGTPMVMSRPRFSSDKASAVSGGRPNNEPSIT